MSQTWCAHELIIAWKWLNIREARSVSSSSSPFIITEMLENIPNPLSIKIWQPQIHNVFVIRWMSKLCDCELPIFEIGWSSEPVIARWNGCSRCRIYWVLFNVRKSSPRPHHANSSTQPPVLHWLPICQRDPCVVRSMSMTLLLESHNVTQLSCRKKSRRLVTDGRLQTWWDFLLQAM